MPSQTVSILILVLMNQRFSSEAHIEDYLSKMRTQLLICVHQDFNK